MLKQRLAIVSVLAMVLASLSAATGTVNPHNGENLSAEAQAAFNEECGRDGSGCNTEESEEIFEEDAETPITYTLGDPFGVFSISWVDEY